MGSVKKRHFTPDNDPHPAPSEWHRHYYYCDNCSSFDLTVIITPHNHKELKSKSKFYERYSKKGFIVILIGFLLTYINFLFISIGVLGVVIYLVSNFLKRRLLSQIRELGVRCLNCQKEYSNESSFKTDTENNPMNFSMKDVPKTLYNIYSKDVW